MAESSLPSAGAEVDVASVEDRCEITGSRGVKLVADKLITDCESHYDCIALPVRSRPQSKSAYALQRSGPCHVTRQSNRPTRSGTGSPRAIDMALGVTHSHPSCCLGQPAHGDSNARQHHHQLPL